MTIALAVGGAGVAAPTLTYFMPVPTGVAATDTAALNTALGDATYSVIQFRAGTYVLTPGITTALSNKTFVGNPVGGGTTLTVANSVNYNWMFSPAAAVANFTCKDLIVDCNYQNQASGTNGFLDAGTQVCTFFTFENVTFKNTRTNFINAQAGTDWVFRFCTFDTMYAGGVVHGGCSRWRYFYCLFKNMNIQGTATGPALSFQPKALDTTLNCNHVTIELCHFYPGASVGFAIEFTSGADGVYHDGFLISGNLFDANGSLGTGVSGNIGNSTITGNTWQNGSPGNHRSGIEVAGPNITIVGNTIENGAISFIKVLSYTATPQGMSIVGNTIRNTSASVTGLTGINCSNYNDIQIVGNLLEFNLSGTATLNGGIYIGGYSGTGNISRCVVSNNVLRGLGTQIGQGIRVISAAVSGGTIGPTSQVTVKDNIVSNFVNGIFLSSLSYDVDLTVANNDLVGNGTAINGTPRGAGYSCYGNRDTTQVPGNRHTVSKTGAYTATHLDEEILCDTSGAGFTVTLPDWPAGNQLILLKKTSTDANTLTVAHNQNLLEGAIANQTTALTTRPTLRFQNNKRSQAATITIASPGVVTATAHGLISGSAVVFSSTGALPTGITGGTIYYVIATGLTANAFQFSTTVGGVAVNTSGTQSGTHTIISNAWWQL